MTADTAATARVDIGALRPYLERLYRTYHDPAYLQTDPLRYVHRFADRHDMEVVAMAAAALAYGRVGSIFRAVDEVLRVMGRRPYRYVMGLTPAASEDFCGFRHRFTTGADLAGFLFLLRGAIRRYETLEGAFMAGYERGGSMREALERFVDALSEDKDGEFHTNIGLPRGVRFLLVSPRDGSACKRMNLFLRWMVRPNDGLDLGLWREVSPADLIIPVDTHVGRICRCIGLTGRSGADWRMAEEITTALRVLDRRDPVRYDFAISRIGILNECSGIRTSERCGCCGLRPVCVL